MIFVNIELRYFLMSYCLGRSVRIYGEAPSKFYQSAPKMGYRSDYRNMSYRIFAEDQNTPGCNQSVNVVILLE